MAYEKFSADNAALLLIDHQIGTMGWAKSLPFEELKRNALMLAKTAKILKMPTVLTSSMEEYAQGPLLSELETILPAEFAAVSSVSASSTRWTTRISPRRSKRPGARS
jgi:nicotinamidase-related amidase